MYRILLLTWMTFTSLNWIEPMPADQVDVWIGTGGAHGIYHLVLDRNEGTIGEPELAADVSGAGFLVMNHDGTTLYSTGRDGNEGWVASFSILPVDGRMTLQPLNVQDIGDSGATHLNLDRDGKLLFSAQYGGGSIAVFPIEEGGQIGERTQLIKHHGGARVVENRQDEPHPHWIGTSPGNRFVCVPDLGLDQVVVYRLDTTVPGLVQKSVVSLANGSGPRHMTFHANGKFAFVLNELAMTITVLSFDEASGDFEVVQVIKSLPESLKDRYTNAAAEIQIHPNGNFVYASNRGHDSISVFELDKDSGKLSFVERIAIRGSWPRSFSLDPSGNWLIAAGRYSNTLSLFEVDTSTGKLTFTRKIVNVPAPICVLFGSLHD